MYALTLSPFLNVSLGINSSLLIIASLFPRSTIKFPNSILLTIPTAISPTLSLYSSYWLDLSASRTFCIITPFAFCAATLPNSIGGSSLIINSPILIEWLIFFYW